MVRSGFCGLAEPVFARSQILSRECFVEVLPTDSAKLAEVLNEMFALLVGEEEIKGWRPPALEEVLSRLTEPLTGLH